MLHPSGSLSVLQGFAHRGHSLGSLWNALNLLTIAAADSSIDVVHQSDQRLLLLPVPDPNLRMHKVHAVLQGEFIGRPVCSASQHRKAHADGGEFAKPALYNARIKFARFMDYMNGRRDLFRRFRGGDLFKHTIINEWVAISPCGTRRSFPSGRAWKRQQKT